MRQLLDASDSGAGARVVIPAPVLELTTRCGGLALSASQGQPPAARAAKRPAAAPAPTRAPGPKLLRWLTPRAAHPNSPLLPTPPSPLRRVLTMEWVSGVKLTTLPPEEIRSLVGVGQEAFLVQLLEIGFIHGDPHPGERAGYARGLRSPGNRGARTRHGRIGETGVPAAPHAPAPLIVASSPETRCPHAL